MALNYKKEYINEINDIYPYNFCYGSERNLIAINSSKSIMIY